MSDLPTYLSKWLCHDLATPAATVMTASELLGPVSDPEINALVQDGAKRLVARLRLIRAAFGPGGAPMGAGALERLVRDGLEGTPLTWARPGDASGPEVSFIAGAAMLLADLARGSALTVAADAVRWDKARELPGNIANSLDGGAATDARSAVGAMVFAAAGRAGLVPRVTDSGIAWG